MPPLSVVVQLCDHKVETDDLPLEDTPPVTIEFFIPNAPPSLTDTSESTDTSKTTAGTTCVQKCGSEKTETLKIIGRRSGSSSPAKAGSLKREDGHGIPKTLQQEFSLVNLSIPNMTVEEVGGELGGHSQPKCDMWPVGDKLKTMLWGGFSSCFLYLRTSMDFSQKQRLFSNHRT